MILVDDRSLEDLGRWPLRAPCSPGRSRCSTGPGRRSSSSISCSPSPTSRFPPICARRHAPPPKRSPASARTVFAGRLETLADSDRDDRFAAAIGASGHVLLPIGLSFVGAPGEGPAWLSASAYARFDKSPLPPVFPLRPTSAVLPIEPLAVAAAGLGHATIAFDRDGAPRYDYAALPFEAGFPALACRYAPPPLISVSPGRRSRLALGAGVQIGDVDGADRQGDAAADQLSRTARHFSERSRSPIWSAGRVARPTSSPAASS